MKFFYWASNRRRIFPSLWRIVSLTFAGYQITFVIGSAIAGDFFQVCGVVSLTFAGYQITFVIGSAIAGEFFQVCGVVSLTFAGYQITFLLRQ